MNDSERSKISLKPKYPRLAFLKLKRKQERQGWYTTAAGDGMVEVRATARGE